MPAPTTTVTSPFKITSSCSTLTMRVPSGNNGPTTSNKRMRNELDGDDLACNLEITRACKRHRIERDTEADEKLALLLLFKQHEDELLQIYENEVSDSPCPEAEQQQQQTPDDDALDAAMEEQEDSPTAPTTATAKAYAQKVAAFTEDLQKSIAEALKQEAVTDKARAERDARAVEFIAASLRYEGSHLYDEPCRERCKNRAKQERKPMPFSDLQWASEDDVHEAVWRLGQSNLQEAKKTFKEETKTLHSKKKLRDQLARKHDKAARAASAALNNLEKNVKQAEVDAFESLLEFKRAYAESPCKSSRVDTLWAVCDVIDVLVDQPSPQESKKSAGRRKTKRTRSSC